MLLQIKSDNNFIVQRLKEIDATYYVVFNTKTKKYEVHSNEQLVPFCFQVPYDSLDERTILYARKTRSSRQSQLIKEIDQQNETLQNQQNQTTKNEILKNISI